ncbi:ATP-binding protein [Streptomyces sp. NPDC001941]|uniref:ATP-binding protein n=1 Tax=Streptomyces sp. NPDC001941 TaxID=3154659 RepID=UPI00332C14D8
MSTSSPDRATYRFVVPNSAIAPKIGRDLLATLLAITGHPLLIEAARLCVSEVITNVHLHTRTALVHLDVSVRPGHVSVAVWDDDWTKRPALAPSGFHTEDEQGRGLLIVTRLSAQWGVAWPVEEARARKRVWFTLDETALAA